MKSIKLSSRLGEHLCDERRKSRISVVLTINIVHETHPSTSVSFFFLFFFRRQKRHETSGDKKGKRSVVALITILAWKNRQDDRDTVKRSANIRNP